MTALPRRRRGEPLLALGLIAACWIGMRVAAWQPAGAGTPDLPGAVQLPVLAPIPASIPAPNPVALDPLPPGDRTWPTAPLAPPVRVVIEPPTPAAGPQPPVAPGLAGGHAMMWLAAVARMPSPEALLEAARQASAPPAPGAPAAALSQPPASPFLAPLLSAPARSGERRWSGDAWALVRGGSGAGSIAAGPGAATYGASQAGAVLRYRLAPGNAHRPTAYLRVSAALHGPREREAAAGLSARPFAAVPVVVAVEGRVGSFSGQTLARPAAMAVTELAPVTLPGKVRAEFYAQAGYVGGLGATAFADGQLRADRRIVRTGGIELRAGGGAWGGAQRGAARLDAGPSATLALAGGAGAARIGFDWRFRLAGAAEPASGPALTVSAGF